MQAQITAEREKRAPIAASEGRPEQINIATGEREAFIARSEGESRPKSTRPREGPSITGRGRRHRRGHPSAAAIRQPGGEQAVQLKVAERWSDAYSRCWRTEATTTIVPGNMTEVRSARHRQSNEDGARRHPKSTRRPVPPDGRTPVPSTGMDGLSRTPGKRAWQNPPPVRIPPSASEHSRTSTGGPTKSRKAPSARAFRSERPRASLPSPIGVASGYVAATLGVSSGTAPKRGPPGVAERDDRAASTQGLTDARVRTLPSQETSPFKATDGAGLPAESTRAVRKSGA